jgi:hypothetical protein
MPFAFTKFSSVAHDLHVGGISRISSSEINREVIKHSLAEITICPAHHLHFWQLPQIVGKCIDIVSRILGIKTKDQFLVLIETQVFVLDVIQLAIDNNDACNKDRLDSSELEYHQRATECPLQEIWLVKFPLITLMAWKADK